MKSWMKITLWSLFILTVIVLSILVRNTLDNLTVSTPKVNIHIDGENSFLTEEELLARLRASNHIYVNQKVKNFKSESVEKAVFNMEEVKDVDVYLDLDGTCYIDVTLRKPIARVFNKYGESFYLDADGYTISASIDHTARVLVVNGDLEEGLNSESINEIINNDSLKTIRKIDDVYRISNYVCNDPLMQSLIGQIHRESTGDFVLIPLVGGQRIIFGSAYSDQEVKEKFKKLKIFYREAIPYEGWNKYSEISLKYENQIVCKKK